MAEQRCEARAKADYRQIISHQCSRRATEVRQGRPVCGQHARIYDDWADRATRLARFRWRWS